MNQRVLRRVVQLDAEQQDALGRIQRHRRRFAEEGGAPAYLRVPTVGDAVVFLASPASAWTTGQLLTIDGGVTLPGRVLADVGRALSRLLPGLVSFGAGALTVGFFLVSFGLHWLFGWYAFADEARQHGATPELNGYLVEMGRDTFENWQSEFLQLFSFVVLAALYNAGYYGGAISITAAMTLTESGARRTSSR